MPRLHPLIAECFTTAGMPVPAGSGNILHTPQGRFFAKTGPMQQLQAEAASLSAMGATAPSLVPKVIGHIERDGTAALVTTYAESSGPRDAAAHRALGLALGQMHSGDRGEFGFDCDTFCGVTRQDNTWEKRWDVFFQRRLGDLVVQIGDARVSKVWDTMVERAVPLLLDISPPSVPLHGDLWAGNVAWTDGGAVIFDPAGYYGHGEADLGIARMFGGFQDAFYDAYHEVHPRSEPFYAERQRLYELYHHLNHTLMFGGGYRSGALRIMEGLVDWASGR